MATYAMMVELDGILMDRGSTLDSRIERLRSYSVEDLLKGLYEKASYYTELVPVRGEGLVAEDFWEWYEGSDRVELTYELVNGVFGGSAYTLSYKEALVSAMSVQEVESYYVTGSRLNVEMESRFGF